MSTTTKNKVNAQNIYLNSLRTNATKVKVYLANGTSLHGAIRGYDEFTIVLENADKQTLVYKSAVLSITPDSNIKPIKEKYQ